MRQCTYCDSIVFVKPIVEICTTVCRTHGKKEGLYYNIYRKDLIYITNPFDYCEDVYKNVVKR